MDFNDYPREDMCIRETIPLQVFRVVQSVHIEADRSNTKKFHYFVEFLSISLSHPLYLFLCQFL